MILAPVSARCKQNPSLIYPLSNLVQPQNLSPGSPPCFPNSLPYNQSCSPIIHYPHSNLHSTLKTKWLPIILRMKFMFLPWYMRHWTIWPLSASQIYTLISVHWLPCFPEQAKTCDLRHMRFPDLRHVSFGSCHFICLEHAVRRILHGCLLASAQISLPHRVPACSTPSFSLWLPTPSLRCSFHISLFYFIYNPYRYLRWSCSFVYLLKIYIPCLEWKFCEVKNHVYFVHLWVPSTFLWLHLIHGESSVIIYWLYESG